MAVAWNQVVAHTRAQRTFYWPALAEVFVFAGAIALYIWWWRRNYAWTGALILAGMILSHVLRGESPRRLGFGWRNFKRSFLPLLGIMAGFAAVALGIGWTCGTIKNLPPWQGATDLAYYFVWGFVQEYVLNGFFVNRLELFHGRRGRRAIPFEAAVLFAMAHTPNWFLMLVALAAGWVVSSLYLKYRSLYLLGFGHGVIGFCIILLVPNWISGGLLVGRKYLSRY